jgi:hypothetical protein
MRLLMMTAVLAIALGGCASADWPFNGSASLLARADRLADRQQYEPALRTYDEFLARFPTDPAAPRAQKSRDTIASIVTGRGLRQETERLRADLEKLKEVDLNLERKKR